MPGMSLTRNCWPMNSTAALSGDYGKSGKLPIARDGPTRKRSGQSETISRAGWSWTRRSDSVPSKNPEVHKRAMRRYREAHPERVRVQGRTKHAARRDRFNVLKDKPCADCGVKYPPYVMQFDHREPQRKSFGIARAMARHFPLREVHAEVGKCDLVCANCHAERTHQRRQVA